MHDLIKEANTRLLQGSLADAMTLFGQVLREDPANFSSIQGMGIANAKMGNFGEALRLMGHAVAIRPDNARAHYNLGRVFGGLNRNNEAFASYTRAIVLKPDLADAHNNRSGVLEALERYPEALASCERAITLRPFAAESHSNRAIILLALKRYSEALVSCERAIALTPGGAEAYSNRATILLALRRDADALASGDRAIALRLDIVEAHNTRGAILHVLKRYPEALASCGRAIALGPDVAAVYITRGAALQGLMRYPEAAASYHKALFLRPGNVMALSNLAVTWRDAGRNEEAAACYREILSTEPDHAQAHLCGALNELRILYETDAELREARNVYRHALEELARYGARAGTELAAAVGSSLPFFLAYQGEDDRELQGRYGQIVCDAMAGAYPEFAKPLAMPQPNPDGRLRIGIVSGYFRRHSNWYVPIKGWTEQLNRDRYKLYGYYTDVARDAITDEARGAFDQFVEGIAVDQLMKRIAQDRLHVLIYPEIGMDAATTRLAALRLAPVQCASWGHPDTSGMPTIDYFLSSDLMEPEGAERYYTERLVRLPNLSIDYAPQPATGGAVTRRDVGLRDDAVVYVCCQSLFKYLPQHDALLAAIAARVPAAQFLFVGDPQSAATRDLRERLGACFAAAGLDAGRHIVMAPRVLPDRFPGLLRLGDVYLDSVGWSGGNTTLEAIACDLPVVTLPTGLMRGRHSMAILRRMGVEGGIAVDAEGYVAIAAGLADPAARAAMRDAIVARRHLLYNDAAPVRALEDFLERAVAAAAPA